MELDPVPPRSVAIPILSRRLVEPDVVAFVKIMIGSLISLAALVGIVLGARVLWRIGSRPATQAVGSSATREELQRLQNAVDAIAIEVERISESQRFTITLLGNRLPPPDAAHNGERAGGGSASRIESPR